MSGIKADADDLMEITVHFKIYDIPESIAHLRDEYNKHI
jgi:hypothetical protein